jgi:hypothetical protein
MQAIAALERMFGGALRLIESRIDKLESFPFVPDSNVRALNDLVTCIRSLTNEFRSNNLHSECTGLGWVIQAKSKLSQAQRMKYTEYCKDYDLQPMSLDNLANWAAEQVTLMNILATESKRSKPKTPTTKPATKSTLAPKPSVFTNANQDDGEESDSMSEETSVDFSEVAAWYENEMLCAANMETGKDSGIVPNCVVCKTPHLLVSCSKFKNLTPTKRRELIMQNKLCILCFRNHYVKTCSAKFRCKACKGKHHSLLHQDSAASSTTKANANIDDPGNSEPAPTVDKPHA